jgi:hypothetical protein
LAALAFVVCLASSTIAQVPAADLARPPAGARHFIIVSTAGPHGESWSWIAPDGTRTSRESLNLRGQVFELDAAGAAGVDGMPGRLTIRGVTPQGNAAETFLVENGRARWKSPVDGAETAYSAPRYYTAFGGPIDMTAWIIETLLTAPGRTLDLIPGGQARAEKLTAIDVGEGARKQTITAWAVSGLNNAPLPIWTDAHGKFFAVHFGLAWLPEGMNRRLRLSRRRRTTRSPNVSPR